MKYQRLEDLRTDHDLTIRQVADYLGCNRDVYTRYEKGVRQLPISNLHCHPSGGAVSGQSGLSGRHQR